MECPGTMEGPSPLFANLYMYAVNKAAFRVLGRSALVLSRSVAEDVWSYLVSRGLAPPNPTFSDLRRLFVETLRLAEDVEVKNEGDLVTITLKGLTVSDFLESAMREGFEPVLCPLASILVKACENMKEGRLRLLRFEPLDSRTVRVVCSYLPR